MHCKKFYRMQSILQVLLLLHLLCTVLDVNMYKFYNLQYSFSNNFNRTPFEENHISQLHTFICVVKREIQDGRLIKCKHNLNVIYSACLLCGISVAQRISIYASIIREKRSRETLITQHPPLYLFNMLKVPIKNNII